MKIYRFWAAVEKSGKDKEGSPFRLKKWGGSNDSFDDAKRRAEQALAALSDKLASIRLDQARHYDYMQRDIKEEVIGEPTDNLIITRNGHGCLVMNTASAMFVDIDRRFGTGWLAKIFGNTEEKFLECFDTWMQQHPDMGARVYRTAAGLRYLFTHTPIKPDDRAMTWLQEMHSDRLYIRLCKAQECYRARLSPKPWRIKLDRPTAKFPRETAAQQASFAQWLSAYENKSRAYAVCKFVKAFGNKAVHPDIQPLVWQHDQATGVNTSLPLA